MIQKVRSSLYPPQKYYWRVYMQLSMCNPVTSLPYCRVWLSTSLLLIRPGLCLKFLHTLFSYLPASSIHLLLSRYLGPDRRNLTLIFDEKTTLVRSITAECIPAADNVEQSPDRSTRIDKYKYRQIRHDITGASQYDRTLPGVRPTHMFRWCLNLFCFLYFYSWSNS